MRLTSKGEFSKQSGAEAKRKLTGKFILPKTIVANRSVVLKIQKNKIFNSFATHSSPEDLGNLAPISIPAEGTPLLDPPPSALILRPDLRALTPPRQVKTPSRSVSLGPVGPVTLT